MFIKDNQAVIGKMRELCALLLEQEAYKDLKQSLDRFADDSDAAGQYDRFVTLHQSMTDKEKKGLELSGKEIENYNREERALYDNDVIRKYMFAEQEFHHLLQTLNEYYTKTVEFGRLPESKEIKKASRGCGSH